MKYTEWLEDVLNDAKKLTQEDIDKLSKKHFYSGRRIVPGDQMLFGTIPNLTCEGLKLINFHPEEFETLYEMQNIDQDLRNSKIIRLKLKTN